MQRHCDWHGIGKEKNASMAGEEQAMWQVSLGTGRGLVKEIGTQLEVFDYTYTCMRYFISSEERGSGESTGATIISWTGYLIRDDCSSY